MRTHLTLLGVFLGHLTVTVAIAQGTVNFNNRIARSVDARVVYGEYPVAGTNWSAQLYAGPAGTAEADLVPVGPKAVFRSGNPLSEGYIVPAGEVRVAGIAPGEMAMVQMRVWYNEGGRYATWEEACYGSEFGRSSLIDVRLGGFIGPDSPPGPPSDLVGMNGFDGGTVEPRVRVLRGTSSLQGGVWSTMLMTCAGVNEIQVRVSDTLGPPQWQPITPQWDNLGGGQIRLLDPDTGDSPQRFYLIFLVEH